ncbi:hypothetical protein RJ639_017528 [Escallonia herrerae]|uniref:Uncharacterized protein n=1 Tax=Escallonia herrerae TaxID=1293975 RepID=A0AA88VEH0_9ASTE|nr:hypothetical protein RJ639_017528 [Escallonia herrerae]
MSWEIRIIADYDHGQPLYKPGRDAAAAAVGGSVPAAAAAVGGSVPAAPPEPPGAAPVTEEPTTVYLSQPPPIDEETDATHDSDRAARHMRRKKLQVQRNTIRSSTQNPAASSNAPQVHTFAGSYGPTESSTPGTTAADAHPAFVQCPQALYRGRGKKYAFLSPLQAAAMDGVTTRSRGKRKNVKSGGREPERGLQFGEVGKAHNFKKPTTLFTDQDIEMENASGVKFLYFPSWPSALVAIGGLKSAGDGGCNSVGGNGRGVLGLVVADGLRWASGRGSCVLVHAVVI